MNKQLSYLDKNGAALLQHKAGYRWSDSLIGYELMTELVWKKHKVGTSECNPIL